MRLFRIDDKCKQHRNKSFELQSSHRIHGFISLRIWCFVGGDSLLELAHCINDVPLLRWRVFVLIKVLSEGDKPIIRTWSKMAHILFFSQKKLIISFFLDMTTITNI